MEKLPGHKITDHEGILKVEPQDDGQRVAITYDPEKLDPNDLRQIAQEHLSPCLDSTTPGLRRWVMRLDGDACEAAAVKLEKRIESVSGVQRASATYIGQVLCLTFDSGLTDETSVLTGIRAAGAKVTPLKAKTKSRKSIFAQAAAGELNEELFCLIGLLTLIAAAILEFTRGSSWITGILFGASYLFGGFQGVRSATASLRERTLDIDLLMILAALGAAAVGAPLEGALLLFLFSFSNILQHRALQRTQRAIESLLTLRPDQALRKSDSITEMVPIESLQIGDIVIVRPGEHIPVDGTVVEGSSNVNESSLTGESFPVAKSQGLKTFAGTLNQSGSLEIRVDRPANDSTLAKMVKLVAEAQAEKSTTQRFLEKAEQRYAAGVIAFTALVFFIPWLFWGTAFHEAFLRAMTVMVVASPCALIISTPATVLSAIGGAARRGILIKGGAHLETAARIDIVCLDKTGTLTAGKPTVTEIITPTSQIRLVDQTPGAVELNLLGICAALEEKSEHPLAAAVVHAARSFNLNLPTATNFNSVPGMGAEATVNHSRFLVGSGKWMRKQSAQGMDPLESHVAALENDGKTCIWFAKRDGDDPLQILAVFALADTLRPEARDLGRRLRAMGVKQVVMLTGDQPTVAKAIARDAGLDDFRAGLLPEDKVAAVRELKSHGTVMMVGDGVNDAPALATAHLGVAMGAVGTDVAMETADVVLMADKLENIATLLGTARHARVVLKQNLTFASLVIATLVAGALGFNLPLPVGVIGHEGSTVLVCLNGLRLLMYKPED